MTKKKTEYKLLTNPPDPTSHQSIVTWLSSTGWVEGFIRKKISPLDKNLLDDYIQESWIQILTNKNLVDVYSRGKGKLINYIKSIINHTIYSSSSPLYKNLKKYSHTHIGLEFNDLSNLSDYGTLDVETYFPQINREKGIQNRIEWEIDHEKIYTETNADRVQNRYRPSYIDTGDEIESF